MRRIPHALRNTLYAFLLLSCASSPSPAQVVTVYATPSAQLWMTDVYACAETLPLIIKIEPNEPDIQLRLGEPENLLLPAYQIGEEEILVVVNDAIPVRQLTQAETRDFFLRGNPSAQIWVFSQGEDIQDTFERLALSGSRVTSTARVASDLKQMSDILASQSNAVGILPKRALTGNMHAIYSAGTIPVLAVTKREMQESAGALLACLQTQAASD